MRKKILSFAKGLLLIYLCLLGGLYFAQRNMLFVTSKDKPDIQLAKVSGLSEITVRTDDGLDLFGWYIKPVQDKPVIVWLHGNASSVLWNSYKLPPYLLEGYGSLLMEYRGYSGNPGKPHEEGLYKDARAFLSWLIHDQKIPQNRIILYAESIGTGAAVQMAAEHPELKAIVLEAPFTSAVEAAGHHYWYVPVHYLMKDKFDNIGKIADIRVHVIIVHGDKDRIIPYSLGRKLFNAANQPKIMLTIEGAGHNDLHEYDISSKVLPILAKEYK